MRWPFRRRPAVAAASAVPRPAREWASVPPIALDALRPMEVSHGLGFPAGLATRWHARSMLQPLGHEVRLDTPPGLVWPPVVRETRPDFGFVWRREHGPRVRRAPVDVVPFPEPVEPEPMGAIAPEPEPPLDAIRPRGFAPSVAPRRAVDSETAKPVPDSRPITSAEPLATAVSAERSSPRQPRGDSAEPGPLPNRMGHGVPDAPLRRRTRLGPSLVEPVTGSPVEPQSDDTAVVESPAELDMAESFGAATTRSAASPTRETTAPTVVRVSRVSVPESPSPAATVRPLIGTAALTVTRVLTSALGPAAEPAPPPPTGPTSAESAHPPVFALPPNGPGTADPWPTPTTPAGPATAASNATSRPLAADATAAHGVAAHPVAPPGPIPGVPDWFPADGVLSAPSDLVSLLGVRQPPGRAAVPRVPVAPGGAAEATSADTAAPTPASALATGWAVRRVPRWPGGADRPPAPPNGGAPPVPPTQPPAAQLGATPPPGEPDVDVPPRWAVAPVAESGAGAVRDASVEGAALPTDGPAVLDADAIYDQVRARLRAELLIDRERSSSLTDLT